MIYYILRIINSILNNIKMNDKYKITEEDFTSAELALYPAVKSREVGIVNINVHL